MSYNNPTEKKVSEVNHIGYKLVLNETFGGQVLVAILFRGDEAMGSFRCQSQEEYEWLKERLTGSKRLGL
jgi:hypothetical protein